MRKRRLDLGLTYDGAARRIGTNRRAIYDWEFGRFEPTISCLPKILRFLGYDPRPEPRAWSAWLKWYRERCGLSQPAMARRLGVAARTVWNWETDGSQPTGKNLQILSALRARS